MSYEQQIIDKVAELAAVLTPISDIAVLLGIDEDALRIAIRDHNSAVSRAYRTAKAETALQMRRQELELARVGSPLAAQLTSDYLRTMESDEDL